MACQAAEDELIRRFPMGNEWILLTFACLSVLAAGLFSAAARGEVLGEDWRLTAVSALISLCLSALSGLSALFSLGHPTMVLGALQNPGSGIFWELLSSAGFVIFSGCFVLALQQAWSQMAVRWFAGLGVLCATVLLVAIGKSFHMEWRSTLNTWSILIAFPGWGLCSYALASTLLSAISHSTDAPAKDLIIFHTVGIICVLCYPAALYIFGSEEAATLVSQFIFEDVPLLFWGGLVIGTLLLPWLLRFLFARNGFVVLTGLLLCVIGSALFQWMVIQLGSSQWHFFIRQ